MAKQSLLRKIFAVPCSETELSTSPSVLKSVPSLSQFLPGQLLPPRCPHPSSLGTSSSNSAVSVD